jgi:branched-chain amino acid aminotransferase
MHGIYGGLFMAAGFSLSLYPVRYQAQWTKDNAWDETWVETVHMDVQEEAALDPESLAGILQQRNDAGGFPLINYTTQYGFGVFEGLKAYPQKDGGLKLFRPDCNGLRFRNSMEGLKMPGFPENLFLKAVKGVVARNAKLGFRPRFEKKWENDHFLNAEAIYLRPFTLAEGGIGLNLSYHPWVIVSGTPVGSYFDLNASSKAITTNMVRANSHGTGWIKCDANYVIPTLAKKDAVAKGYMEAVFLDAKERTYIEEGSSCNIFFYLKNGSLVTPELEDRILDGVNRRSVLVLAQDLKVKTEERPISIAEVMDQAVECFVTGTAAGVAFLESLTHDGRTTVFGGGKMGELTTTLVRTLKGIQYGALPDKFGWMVEA